MAHLLLIEDDAGVRHVVEQGLGEEGFTISSAPDGESGLELLGTDGADFDLLLLDFVLPGKGGLDVLKEVRALAPGLPVVALTLLGDTTSKVNGLDAGADDYVTKPFSIEELAARIRAHLRRRDEVAGALSAGPLTLDLATHRVLLHDEEVPLSARELGLLAAFMRHPGKVLSRDALLREVWALDFDPGSNVVEVFVRSLRRKIGAEFIETVWGRGYRFSTTPGEENA